MAGDSPEVVEIAGGEEERKKRKGHAKPERLGVGFDSAQVFGRNTSLSGM